MAVTRSKPKSDSNYIQSYKHYLTLGTFIALPITTLTISSIHDKNEIPVTYTANLSGGIGFSGAYKSLSGSFTFKLPIDPSTVDQYGVTKYKALALRMQNPKYFIGFDYRSTSGYYSDSIIGKTATGDNSYLKRNDISNKQYMLSGMYNFNWKKYSYLAPLNFAERQIKTKVGFLLKASASYHTLHSDSSLISSPKTSTQAATNVADINYISTKVGPGLGWNVVVAKRVYFALQAFYSIDMVAYWYTDNKGNLKNSSRSIAGFVDLRMALGYQSERFYTGFKIVVDQVAVRTTENRISNLFGIFTLDVGYRFNAPGILKKAYKATFTRFLGI
ncbi:MAG: DUF4421 family protein [Cytophagales bacterium]|nr:DUF4421 family protein [Cytophaga sp.]